MLSADGIAYFTSGGGADDPPPPKSPRSPLISGARPNPLLRISMAADVASLALLMEALPLAVWGVVPV
jgi:hypothetical protein